MLEIEILEVDRNKARDLGITPPASEQLIGLNTNDLNKLKSSTNLTNLLTNIQQVFAGKGFSSIPAVVPSAEASLLFCSPFRAALSISPILSRWFRAGARCCCARKMESRQLFVAIAIPLRCLALWKCGERRFDGLPTSTVFPETSFTVGAIHPPGCK